MTSTVLCRTSGNPFLFPFLKICNPLFPNSRPSFRLRLLGQSSDLVAPKMLSGAQPTRAGVAIAFLHGFAGSPKSVKGVALQDALRQKNVLLHIPDLNSPSFERITYTAALATITQMHEDLGRPKWNFVGSSLGGYFAARSAMLNPGVVEKLVLLCPACNFVERMPHIVGRDAFELWERKGSLALPDCTNVPREVHWGLVEDATKHLPYPSLNDDCPTLILHGKHDEIIPLETSQRLVEQNPGVELRVLDDDHSLLASQDIIKTAVEDWFGL